MGGGVVAAALLGGVTSGALFPCGGESCEQRGGSPPLGRDRNGFALLRLV